MDTAHLFRKGKDNSHNFAIQQRRDAEIVAAVTAHPAMSLALARILFRGVPYRVLAKRFQRLADQKYFYRYGG